MKQAFFVFLIALILSPVQGQNISTEELKSFYNDLMNVRISQSSGKVFASNKRVESNSPLGIFTEKHDGYVSYLCANAISVDKAPLQQYADDPQKLKEAYIDELLTDEPFQALFSEMVHRYLQSQGGGIEGYSPTEKLTITKEKLLQRAAVIASNSKVQGGKVRWLFGPKRIGALPTKVDDRAFLIDAFCFMALMNHLGDFQPDVRTLAIGIEDKVKNLEGKKKLAVYKELMQKGLVNSPAFVESVMTEYKEHKDMLNFEVVQ